MTTGGKILNRTDFDTKEVRVGKMKFEGKPVIQQVCIQSSHSNNRRLYLLLE